MVRFSDLKSLTPNIGGSRPDASKPAAAAHFRGMQTVEETAKTEPRVRTLPREAEEERKALYRQASNYLGQVFRAVRGKSTFSLDAGLEIMERIVDLKSPMDALFLKSIHSDESYDFVVNHSVNVAIYAVKMAESLGFDRKRQVEIGMVGLLHDVGMAFIDEEIVYKKEKLSDREFHLFKERPNYGYDILKQFGKDFAYLAESTLQVHERIDGSGYPRSLKEDEINEYAQIIGLVDIYEALIHTRPQREKVLHFYAVKEIIRSGKRKFQQRYLKALLNTFSIFPLQSYVRLNSNAIGRVIQTYPDQPMRPKVQIIYDSHKKRVLTDRLVNLPEHSLLYIVDAVSEEELLELSEESYLIARAPTAEEDEKTGEETASKWGDADRSDPYGQERSIFRWIKSIGPAQRILLIIALALVLLSAGLYLMQSISGEPIGANVTKALEVSAASQPPHVVKGTISPGSSPVNPAPQGKPLPEKTKPNANEKEPAVVPPAAPPAVSSASKKSNKTESPLARPPKEGAFPYSIKLTAVRTRENAQHALGVLQKKGTNPYWVRVRLGNAGVWYRIFSGYYPTRQTAVNAGKKISIPDITVKETVYSTWVGGASSGNTAKNLTRNIAAKGFCPYVIPDRPHRYDVFVGAFYTKKGAIDQQKALAAAGIESRVVRR